MKVESKTMGIRIHGVRKSFGTAKILDDISLHVEAGQFICLLGPSGCGKTTLLRCVAGLDTPDDGAISLMDSVVFERASRTMIPAERRGLGMVFQHYALWPHLKVWENIAYPLRKRGLERGWIETRVFDLAKLIGLDETLDRFPSQLSGGQQQRVALARALAAEPKIMLLDEPLSNLDASLRLQLRRELRSIHNRLGMTTVLVTHDQEEAAALSDVVAVMNRGRVVQVGSPVEILERPANRYVAGFVGYDNFITGRALSRQDDRVSFGTADGETANGASLSAQASGDIAIGDSVTMAVKSDAIKIKAAGTTGNTIVASVIRVTRLGRHCEVEAIYRKEPLIVRTADEAALAYAGGDKICLALPVSSPVFAS